MVLAGCLVSGVLLGAPQALALRGTARTRARWVLGTVGGLFAAVVLVGMASVGRWPHPAALGLVGGIGLGAAQAAAVGLRPTRWLPTSRWVAAAAFGSALLLGVWVGPWSAWGEHLWRLWAEHVMLPLRMWIGETQHEVAAVMLIGLLSGGIGGVGYGAVTAFARPDASWGDESA